MTALEFDFTFHWLEIGHKWEERSRMSISLSLSLSRVCVCVCVCVCIADCWLLDKMQFEIQHLRV